MRLWLKGNGSQSGGCHIGLLYAGYLAVVPPVTSSVPTIIHPSVKLVTPVDDDFQDTEEYVEESLSWMKWRKK